MLKTIANCKHCGAKKFEHETPGFCCRSGNVELSAPDISDELMRLWSSADADDRHFRNNIRFFNGHFSFTSLYCSLDSATANIRNNGIYTFHAHGMIYHNIRSFRREDGKEPIHLELYFCQCFGSPTGEFLNCTFGSDDLLRGHEVYTGSGRMSLCLVYCCRSCYWHDMFVVGVTNGRERELVPSLCGENDKVCV